MDFIWLEALAHDVNTLLYYEILLCIRAVTIYRNYRYFRGMHTDNTQFVDRLFLHNLVCILHSIFYTKSTQATENARCQFGLGETIRLQSVGVEGSDGQATERKISRVQDLANGINLRRALRQIRLKDDWDARHLPHILDVVAILLAQSKPTEIFLLVGQLGLCSITSALRNLRV